MKVPSLFGWQVSVGWSAALWAVSQGGTSRRAVSWRTCFAHCKDVRFLDVMDSAGGDGKTVAAV